MQRTLAERLADWVVGFKHDDLPADVVHHAKRCMLDTLAVQIRGATLPWILPVYRSLQSYASNRGATVTYYGDRLIPAYAAYLNSTFSCACELQHHGSPGSAHTGVVVIPTLQALAEKSESSGREFIAAMVAGYEIQGRIGAALFKLAFKRHFHPEGILGSFGAVAAAGKLLNLSVDELTQAFAIVGSHASGILEYNQSGGEVKRVHGALAARNAIQSVFFAKSGLTGPRTVLEGRNGIFAAFGGGQIDPEQVLAKLASPYCITQCRYRIYPTNGTCHNPLDILNDLLKEHPFAHGDVDAINVGAGEAYVHHMASIKRPHDVIGAQNSLGYSLGVRLVKGSNDLEMYVDPALWNHPEIFAIADKVSVYQLKELSHPRMCRLEVKLKNGVTLTGQQGPIRGSAALPFSDDVIEDKFRALARVNLPQQNIDAILKEVNQLEQMPSIRGLVQLLRSPTSDRSDVPFL